MSTTTATQTRVNVPDAIVEAAGPGRGRRAGLRVTERGRRLLADGLAAVAAVAAVDDELIAAVGTNGVLDRSAVLAVLGLAGRRPPS
jgi:hypothetical protein